jgi:hypothetical protein
MGYHPGLKGCVLHGGSVDDHGRRQFGDAWLFRDGAWSPLPLHTTGVRDDHVLAFHHAADAMVMFGGLQYHPALMTMENDGWRSVSVSAPLPTHQCAPAAYDSVSRCLVLHGGEMHHAGPQFGETYVLRSGAGAG